MGKMREPRLRDDEGREIDVETGERREAPSECKEARELIDMLRRGEGWRIGRDEADEGD